MKINTYPESKKCPHCEKNLATDPHPCPFAQDVNNDNEFECICCDDCTRECAADI
jgi:hypothetical protein